jgi:hypothetical protein
MQGATSPKLSYTGLGYSPNVIEIGFSLKLFSDERMIGLVLMKDRKLDYNF